MKPFTTPDFQQAKANHLDLKSQLQSIINGYAGEQSLSISSQYACYFGRWLYRFALIDYESMPEIHELEQVHATIHSGARHLLKQYQSGLVQEARHGLSDLEKAVDRFVCLLDSVDKKISLDLPALAADPPAATDILTTRSAFLTKQDELTTDKAIPDLAHSIDVIVREHQLLHDFFMQAPAIHCILTGPNHTYSFVNSAYQELVGERDLLGRSVRDALPEVANQGFFELLDRVYTTAEPFVGKEMYIQLENEKGVPTEAYLNFIYQPIKNSGGQAEGILVFAYEVTEQVVTRKKTEESEAKFRAIIEQAPVATCLFVGRDMRVEVANDLMLGYWGKDRSALGIPLAEGVPELIGQPFLDILDRVYTTGETYEAKAARAELRLDGVLGSYYFDFTYKPLFDDQGKVYAIIDTAVDVTSRVLAQQQQQQLATIVEEIPIYVAISNLDGSIRYMNPFGQQLIGLQPEEVTTRHLSEFFDEADLPLVSGEILPALLTVHQWHGQTRMRHFQSGELIPIETNSLALIDESTGHIEALVAVNRDLRPELEARQRQKQIMADLKASEERYRLLSAELEEQVQQRTAQLAAINEELAVTNEELAAANEEFAATNEELEEANQLFSRSNQNLERFAYIASHDLQEPLRKVQQFGDLLSAQYGAQLGDGLVYLERMQGAALRMSTLIRDLLSFSRISTWQDNTTPVPLTSVIETVLNDLELRIQETAAIIQVNPLPTIQGDRSQLEQLFQNLLSNALKFRKPNQAPQITISYDILMAGSLPSPIKPARQARMYYHIQVSDQGIGFEEKYVDRIFQIFQRLHGKNEFAGTGIGLAICEKVVTNHGGAITASSQPGSGATFSVYFPA